MPTLSRCTPTILFWPWPPYNLLPRSCLIFLRRSSLMGNTLRAAPNTLCAFSENDHVYNYYNAHMIYICNELGVSDQSHKTIWMTFSTHFGLTQNKHPLSTHISQPLWAAAVGFREPHNKLAWLRETPYTTIPVFPTVTVTVTPQYQARAGIPLCRGCFNPHTPDSSTHCVRPDETGSQSTFY